MFGPKAMRFATYSNFFLALFVTNNKSEKKIIIRSPNEMEGEKYSKLDLKMENYLKFVRISMIPKRYENLEFLDTKNDTFFEFECGFNE